MYIYMSVYTYICTCIYIFINIYICVCVHMYKHVHIFERLFVYIYIYIYRQTFIFTKIRPERIEDNAFYRPPVTEAFTQFSLLDGFMNLKEKQSYGYADSVHCPTMIKAFTQLDILCIYAYVYLYVYVHVYVYICVYIYIYIYIYI